VEKDVRMLKQPGGSLRYRQCLLLFEGEDIESGTVQGSFHSLFKKRKTCFESDVDVYLQQSCF
jgi:hypothetical protein